MSVLDNKVYGKYCRKAFNLDENKVFLNHGSFGRSPDVVTRKRMALIEENISDLDVWTSDKVPQLYADSVVKLAEFIRADPGNIVIVDNVTTAINVLLKSVSPKSGQKILVTKHCYEGVRRNVQEYVDHDGVEEVIFPIEVPIQSVASFIDSFEKFLSTHHDNIAVALLEHITSASGIVLPVKEMVAICKQYGIFAAVDGAHAPGQLNLNLREIDADFYGGNLHKWCYTSLSCGFFCVAEKHHKKIRPLVTSHYYGANLQKPFYHPGTRDLTAMFTIPTALEFFNELGGVGGVTSYTKSMLKWVESYLFDSLKMTALDIPNEMRAPDFLVLELPGGVIDANEVLKNRQQWASTVSLKPHNVRVFFTAFNNKSFIRISCNVYNTKEDFEKLKEALQEYFKNPNDVKLKIW